MKDGQKTTVKQHPLPSSELAALGWWIFEVAGGEIDNIACWVWEIIDNLESYNSQFSALRFTIAIRRYEDAVLFKLSWPECRLLCKYGMHQRSTLV